MAFYSTKTYGHERGFSCAFRQWRADSHCSLIHGYALSVHLEFKAEELDDRNWVIDFGGLKPVKAMLENMFDHTTVVAEDDPKLPVFYQLEDEGLIDLKIVKSTGCEAFAKLVHDKVSDWLKSTKDADRVILSKVVIQEHGSNGAIYTPPEGWTS